MGHRIFRDPGGVEWQAWDVIPRLGERRRDDRRAGAQPIAFAERRGSSERRLARASRPVLAEGLAHGWLCFETATEKRRLAPIPADWDCCGEERLADYCRDARVVGS